MSVTLSKYWKSLIAEQVASGQYGSPGEVVQEALREWRDKREREAMEEFNAALPQHGPPGEPTERHLAEIDKIVKDYRRNKKAGR
jgi:putative addiction module CopG family antidote